VQNAGYLEAKTIATITETNGNIRTVEWDKNLEVFLPKELEGHSVDFEIFPGPRFYYESLEISTSFVLSNTDVEAFFYSEPYFIEGQNSKVFTPSVFAAGALNLESHLANLGYQEAKVYSEILDLNTASGAAKTKLTLNEGPLYSLKQVNVENPRPDIFNSDFSDHLGKPFNTFLRQDIIQEIRNHFYEQGFAKVQFEHTVKSTPVISKEVETVLDIVITPGAQFRVSSIEFEGADTVRRPLLRKQLSLEEGDFLNPAKLNDSRLNLSRMGFFQKVEYELEDQGEDKQSLKFKLNPRTTWELDSLVGWGSYERLRLGLMAEKLNAFGLGHRLQFKSIISQKSLLSESRYLIPNFLDTRFPFSTKLFYLDREELSFDRKEFGLNLGTSKYLEGPDLIMDVVYTFESLDARIRDPDSSAIVPDKVRAGSIELRFGRDKRDNPLNPQSGYRLFSDFEWASEALGGEVDYQRAEIGMSYHDEIKRGLLWHGSISHAVIGSFKHPQSQIPTNKLLFPGGENSVRGYTRGEAAPRDLAGDFIGAQSYVLLNLELEQRLTNSISIVGFYDAVGMTADIDEYPFHDYLSSIGLGIRFRTFMGPIRFEYGHNLDQRIEDPSGTYHLTIGYPF
jgi:outer membrane protein assembly complex protein YaeT